MNKTQFVSLTVFMTEIWGVTFSTTKTETWYKVLDDLPYDRCQCALVKLSQTNKYPPSVSEIRETVTNVTQITPSDAWLQVEEAMKTYGMYNEKGALESMNPSVARVVKALGFRNLCVSENIMAERAHFMKFYEKNTEADRKEIAVDPKIKGFLEFQKALQNGQERIAKKCLDEPFIDFEDWNKKGV